jgi:hypothetical protein
VSLYGLHTRFEGVDIFFLKKKLFRDKISQIGSDQLYSCSQACLVKREGRPSFHTTEGCQVRIGTHLGFMMDTGYRVIRKNLEMMNTGYKVIRTIIAMNGVYG